MALKKHDRQYDVIVFGATGYTGQYAAEAIAAHLPSNLRWAIAGRSEAKLKQVVDDCKKVNPDRLQPEIEICDLNAEALASLAKKTFVLITTVGPYGKYGEHAFKACAENGTHYLDVTGEVAYTYKMIQRHEAAAKASGAILVPQNGIESAPADLLAYSLVKRLRTDLSAQAGDVTVSIHVFNGSPSGGTVASALGLFDNFTLAELSAPRRSFAASPVPSTAPRPKRSLLTRLTGLVTVPGLGLLTTTVPGKTDTAIVERTWGLLSTTPSRAAEAYGPRFTYREYGKARNWLQGTIMHYAITTVPLLLLLFPPLRWLAKRFLAQPGQGPDREASKKDKFEYRGVAKADPAGGKVAFGKASFNGSMYLISGIYLAQAAATLLEDDLGLGGGVYTPAMLGQGYIDRLDAMGFRIETEVMDG